MNDDRALILLERPLLPAARGSGQKPESLRRVVDLMPLFHRLAGRLGKLFDRILRAPSFYGRVPWDTDEACRRRLPLSRP
jgi:hypothetical protein